MRHWGPVTTAAVLVALVVLALPIVAENGERRRLPENVREIFRRTPDYQRLPTRVSRALDTTIERLKRKHALRAEAPEPPSDEERRRAGEQSERAWQSYLLALTKIDPWLDTILAAMEALEGEEEGDIEQREGGLERAPQWQQNIAQHLEGAGGYEIVSQNTVRFVAPYTGVHPEPAQGSLPGEYQFGDVHMIHYGHMASANLGLVSVFTDVAFMNDFFDCQFLVIEFDAWKSGDVVSTAEINGIQCQCSVFGLLVGDSQTRVQLHSNLHCQGNSVEMDDPLLTVPPPVNQAAVYEDEERTWQIAWTGETIHVQAGAPVRIMIGLSAQAVADSGGLQAAALGACTVSSVNVEIRD